MPLKFPEYDQLDATDLAALVRKGEVSPRELLEAAIERAEVRNPALNAIVYELHDRARERVDSLPDGPFRGVPFLLKDLKITLAGTVTTNSSYLTRNRVFDVSSENAKRYEAAGLQIFGKTNSPEFGIMGITEPALRGPCRNPWNTDHSPGGSSGGASAVVAARIVPVAHGGDGGGSIRIPASATGLFGLKPTRARTTMAPHLGESWGGFVSEHVLARSVRDSAAFLDLVDGPFPGDPYYAPPKARPWLEEVGAPVGKLKIAYTTDTLFAGTTHPDCKAAVEDSVKLLESLGHEVVEGKPEFPLEELVQAYFITVAAGVAAFVEQTAAWAGKKPSHRDFEPQTWVLAQIGWKNSAAELVKSQQIIQKASRQVAAFFEDVDIFVSSTMAVPPVRIGELALSSSEKLQLSLLRTLNSAPLLDLALKTLGTNALARTPNTQLFNQTGQPGMSVPLYWNEAGLPIGTQMVGRFGDEATLFRLAAQLEEARPWANRKGWESAFSEEN